jgi:LacI family transcriptional regulator
MPTTIIEVARYAKVAPSIVSRLLNADPKLHIKPETEARIRTAVAWLNYQPNNAGRALRSTRAAAVGLILPEVTNPVFAESVRGAEFEAANLGYVVLLGRTDDLDTQNSSYRRLIGERRIDGVLVQVSNVLDSATMSKLIDTRVPTVLINSRLEDIPGSVRINDEFAAYLATVHLISIGHRDIGMLAGPRGLYTSTQRQNGYEKAMKEAGLRVRRTWIVDGSYDVDTGRAGMRALLQSPRPNPTAVFVTTLSAAVGALAVVREVGLHVPQDLSIVGLHDFWFAEHTAPPLTTVRTPQFALGVAAMRALADRIKGAAPGDLVVDEPPPELVIRGSTAPPQTGLVSRGPN